MLSLTPGGSVGLVEADHRIANNLASLSAAIRLQRSSIFKSRKPFTAEQVCTLLDDIDARIEVVAKLHQCLARAVNRSGIHLGSFLKQIAELMSTLGSEGKMEITFQISGDSYIDAHQALHAGLIAAGILTNASKYAHPTGLPVKVNLRCDTSTSGSFLVEVTDDGVGFPENFNPAIDGGLGFQPMRTLATGMGAELQF